ncbi:hypothetical protein LCGC14_2405170, partial [marine sediment metagenome]
KDKDELKNVKSMLEEEQIKAILVNHTKKEYVLYSDCNMIDNNGWRINPLPLLTACGNNRGGGDYRDYNKDFDKIGIWANDILSIEFEVPSKFKKIKVKFCEK